MYSLMDLHAVKMLRLSISNITNNFHALVKVAWHYKAYKMYAASRTY
jgi:hypothetical protein